MSGGRSRLNGPFVSPLQFDDAVERLGLLMAEPSVGTHRPDVGFTAARTSSHEAMVTADDNGLSTTVHVRLVAEGFMTLVFLSASPVTTKGQTVASERETERANRYRHLAHEWFRFEVPVRGALRIAIANEISELRLSTAQLHELPDLAAVPLIAASLDQRRVGLHRRFVLGTVATVILSIAASALVDSVQGGSLGALIPVGVIVGVAVGLGVGQVVRYRNERQMLRHPDRRPLHVASASWVSTVVPRLRVVLDDGTQLLLVHRQSSAGVQRDTPQRLVDHDVLVELGTGSRRLVVSAGGDLWSSRQIGLARD